MPGLAQLKHAFTYRPPAEEALRSSSFKIQDEEWIEMDILPPYPEACKTRPPAYDTNLEREAPPTSQTLVSNTHHSRAVSSKTLGGGNRLTNTPQEDSLSARLRRFWKDPRNKILVLGLFTFAGAGGVSTALILGT
ncbi:hypothetical protein BJY01DRAFT_254767 [Aspergillus pseudoustus]|uniref:Uncharacterized protein n=1 Tax=Aspergillus pseudoustus TaxID=1810923 RepID=A0ABR4IQS3_9EURO